MPVSHAPEMIPAERRARIVEALEAQRVVKVATLSDALGVSEITIRRDLGHPRAGGPARAFVWRRRAQEALDRRNGRRRRRPEQAAEKARIAKAAAAMIEPHDTVFLGSGTTVAHLLRYVDPELEARVVTPAWEPPLRPRACASRSSSWAASTALSSNTVEGTWPLDMIVQFNADKAFLGADGLDSKAGLTTPSIAVAGIELAMIRRTRGEVVVLADNNKIGLVCPVVICPLDQIDVVLVDTGVDKEVRNEIQRAGPRCEAV